MKLLEISHVIVLLWINQIPLNTCIHIHVHISLLTTCTYTTTYLSVSDLELPRGVDTIVLLFHCLHKHVTVLSDLVSGPVLSRLLLKEAREGGNGGEGGRGE